MPYDTSSDPYADGGSPSEPQGAQPESKDQEDDSQTELLSKSFFQGKDLQIGSRCEVEIVQIMDDQVAVKYVPHDEEKEDKAAEPQAQPQAAPGDSSMTSMFE